MIPHTYIMEYYSAIKKDEIMPCVVTWMGLAMVMLSDVSQTEGHTSHDAVYIWILKKGADELIYRAEEDSQMEGEKKAKLCLPGVKGGEE